MQRVQTAVLRDGLTDPAEKTLMDFPFKINSGSRLVRPRTHTDAPLFKQGARQCHTSYNSLHRKCPVCPHFRSVPVRGGMRRDQSDRAQLVGESR